MGNLPYIRDSYHDGTSLKERAFSLDDAQYFYKIFRPKSAIPVSMVKKVNSVAAIDKEFSLKGIQFGNWVTTEDKYNYLAITYLCLKDINKILKFKGQNMGLNGLLALSYGARGVSSAAAHFDALNQVINITRYWRTDKINKERMNFGLSPIPNIPKEQRLLKTGGAGAMAHEYGHFLDYSLGRYIDTNKDSNWLSGPYRNSKTKIEYSKNHVLRNKLNNVLNIALEKPDGKPTAFFERIKPKPNKSDYWIRRLEVFARIFEQYISFKMKELKIDNKFLSQPVYDPHYYLRPAEFKKVLKPMDDLIKEMRKVV
jgi:hypothetical protein